MTDITEDPGLDEGRDARILKVLRIVGWGGVLLLIALPAIAMALGAEGVDWGGEDFIAAAILLGGSGLLIEGAVRVSGDWSYRIAAGLAVAATLMMIWANLAVGIVGSEDNAFNVYYFALLPVLAAGTLMVRLRASGMAGLMRVATIFFIAMLVATYIAGGDRIELNGAVGLVGIHAFFAIPYFVASLLFDRSAGRYSAT